MWGKSEKFGGGKPLVFTEKEPDAAPESSEAEASVAKHEKPAYTGTEGGEARFKKMGAFFGRARERISSFFTKTVPETSRAAMVGLLSTPELARESGAAVRDTVEQGAVSFNDRVRAAGDRFNGGLDNAANWVSDTSDAFEGYLKQKGEALAAAGKLAVESTAEDIEAVRAGIGAGIDRATDWGARNIARLERASAAGWRAFTDARNQTKLKELESKHQSSEAELAAFRQKLGLNESVPLMVEPGSLDMAEAA